MAKRICASRTALAILVLCATPALAQNGADVSERAIAAVQVEAGPAPENWKDSLLWDLAVPAGDFVQTEPVEGARASERTEVRVLYDADAIYIGAWLYDTEPDRIVAGERRRDANLSQSDGFRVILDTYRDLQNGFVFGTNPGGIEYDGQLVNEGQGGGGGGGGRRQQGGAGGGLNVNWDGSWTVDTSRDNQGWYAYFRIPFSTLRYGADAEQEWGINFSRNIGRKNEDVYWSPVPRQYNLYRLSYAGVLHDLQVPAQRVVTFTPYALGSAQRLPAVHEGVRYPYEFGADAKIGVTQGLTLDLTYNTDFAQVEVDEQQVDLTRFSLFFPEKRPFFLENAGLFAVGNNQAAELFFSRRIGISRGGTQVPIDGGLRLSGRAGNTDVGLLHIRTAGLESVQGANAYSVVRVARELPNRSQIGGILTDRSALNGPRDYGRTYGVDGRLGIGEAWTFTGVAGATEQSDGPSESRETVMLSGEYRTADWRLASSYNRVGANFDPQVGFLRRSDFWSGSATVFNYYRTPQISWLRELRPHASYDVSYSLDGFKETERVHLDSHIAWENGAMFSPATDYIFDGLSSEFTISPGVTVQPGNYAGWQFMPRFNTSTQAPLVFRTGGDIGSFLSGTLKSGFATLEFRRGATLAGQVQFEHNQVDLAEGSFDASLARVRIGYSFSPNLFLQSLVQYSNQTDVWSGNLRLGWLDTAGTGLFIVYNERQATEGILRPNQGTFFQDPLERTLLIKFTRQFDMAGVGRDVLGW
ncbi:MAG: DUF5916 domain-containing protein [Gemmatimonadota bacterium]